MPTKNPYDIIIAPLISEKGVASMEDNKYCFKVATYANKSEVKSAVENIFKVEVLNVNTMNFKGKPKRQGAFIGKKSDWKKAVVTLREGHKIEVFEGA